MCPDPITAALLGITTSLGSSALGFLGNQSAANKQVEYDQQKQIANLEYRIATDISAKEDFANNVKQENLSVQEFTEKSAVEQQQIALKNKESKSEAQAATIESNVAGNSIDYLLNNYDRATAQSSFYADKNLKYMKDNSSMQMKNYQAVAMDHINSIEAYKARPVNNDNIASSVFSMFNKTFQASVDAYSFSKSFVSRKNPKRSSPDAYTTNDFFKAAWG